MSKKPIAAAGKLKALLGLALLFATTASWAAVNRVAPPKNQQELEKMMRVTINQHILVPGAAPATLERLLEIGEVIMFFDHPKEIPWMSAAGMLIDAPCEEVYAVVMDHAHYREFVPMNEGITATNVFDGLYKEDLHINVKMAFISYRMDYSLYNYRRPPYRTDWSLAEGEFDRNLGFWELIPTPDKKKTMAFEAIYSEPRSTLLKSLFEREPSVEMMTNVSTATITVQAIKKEAEKRRGVKPAASSAPSPGDMEKILESDPATMRIFLERGNLVILQNGPTVYSVAGGIVNAPIETAYSVITDFPSYPQFVEGVKKAEFISGSNSEKTYKWNLEFDLAFLKYIQTPQWTYHYSEPTSVTWQIDRPCCGPAQGFWKLVPAGDKTIIFNGTTADVASLGRIPKYALSVEPTLQHASLTSQALLVMNSMKSRISQKTNPAKEKK